ncbi:MAG TPA: PIN domain-containing protein [Flavobacteriales bacterium]|nr:PIN domain-containing protein [Flavobacteriales bacterium]MCB0817933.1 PIN domain-containing protein [Flavobacteriales bacterium]HOP43398.1 PIN domain-containing protein [Flavobacteriales bacterium]HPF68548.1 PIN domain-containing protein [Flavobacteriales bacterium]HPQ57673.1 PIN domain-containing protein [Flavobacteriales bacterium]
MLPNRLFVDANILVTVLCHEYPRFGACARVLSLADDPRFEVWTSPLALAIGAYFSGKKSGRKKAREKVALLATKLHITNMDQEAVRKALADPKATDLEDGMQYYAALHARCVHIITYDRKDFGFSKLPVQAPEDFLLEHLLAG